MIKKIPSRFVVRILPLTAALALFSCAVHKNVTTKELQSEIRYLSSDSLKGRLTGSAGDSLAAQYILDKLSSYGFKPLEGDGLQRFRVTKRVVAGKNNFLTVDGVDYTVEKQFIPLAFSSNASLEGEVVFAGYGFSIDGDSLKWDDYKGQDVNGKWVLILRADPDPENNKSPFLQFSGDRDKTVLAKDMGAAGVLMVSGPNSDKEDVFDALGTEGFSAGIPVLRIKREVADRILTGSGFTIEMLEKKLNETHQPNSFRVKPVVKAVTEIVRETAPTRNVVMYLPGEDDQLKSEYVVFGAHFDHLGMGGPGSSSRAVDTVGVHHGADDNASGVAMMLELAEKFAMTKGSHKRSLVCVAFTGEEEGLLGSKQFTANPGIDLKKVNAMINLDMVGRLKDPAELQIFGVGTADGMKNLIYAKTDTSAIKLALLDEGYGPSDHSSFYLKNIPVLFFSTGAHLDYHTPADTYDKINYEGMVKISDIIFSISSDLATSPQRLQFRESGPRTETVRPTRGRGVTLGIMPDFAGVVKNGLRADFVTPGKPAAMGGMKKGDIITAINGKPVNNIEDYMFRMKQLKRGETINVEILRNNEKTVLIIQL